MIEEHEMPGYVDYVRAPAKWLDYLFKSKLSSEHKLVGVVIQRTCRYNHKYKRQESLISHYSISRILGETQDTIARRIDELAELGYLFDTGKHVGARRIYTLTFSLLPLGEMKQ